MGTTGQSITLANSIIGVGILAMPFCFQQCGVLLATLILLSMGLVSRLCCYFLLKSALLARRRNFEFLAFHVFGSAGKLAVEVGIIGFLMGTCIAYFVVVGDLGPQIIAKMFNINQSDILRTSIMVIVSLVCVLPLGLLRNVDSLSNVSAATIGFYFCLVMKVISEAASQLVSGEWPARVALWRPAGVLQCVPIFSMALFCQTQLFEIFESLPTLSLEKMSVVTKNAIHICAGVYFTLGLFGYIAFSAQNISGNILMSLSPTMANDVIKLGFVMSLAFSFPLIIFPCRASLYSFLYRKVHQSHHDHIINHSIPETTFRCITVAIIAVTLFISLLIPNIELVLGLVGSTIGVMICVVFPAACFINVTFKNTNERVLAKGVLLLGLLIMVLGTYANLQAAESAAPDRYDDKAITQERIDKIVEDFFEKMEKSDDKDVIIKPLEKNEAVPNSDGSKVSNEVKDSEVQPPNPVPPESQSGEKEPVAAPDKDTKLNDPDKLPIDEVDKVSETHPKNLQNKLNEAKIANGAKKNEIIDKPKEKPTQDEQKPTNQEKIQEKIDMMKQQQLVETIKQHGVEQKELIKEQKELLEEILKTKDEMQQNKKEADSNEAKKIAVESIQKIANIAIQSLSGVSDKPINADGDKKSEPLEKIANEAVQEIAKKAVETMEAIKEIQEKPKDAPKVENNANIATGNDNTRQSNVANPVPVQNNVQASQNIPSSQNVPPSQNIPQSSNVQPSQNMQPVKTPLDNSVKIQNTNNLANEQPVANMQPVANVQPVGNNQPVANIPQSNPNYNGGQVAPNKPSSQPIQNNLNGNQKAHSHSPDEPRSYKQGEELQKDVGPNLKKNIVQNVPLALAMNGNSQVRQPQNAIIEPKPAAVLDKLNNNVQNEINVQNNGAKDVVNNLQNQVARQKREVVDCTEKTSLKPEDKEICETLVDKPNVNPKFDDKSQELLKKVDLNNVLQKTLPIDTIHLRSLKSYDEIKKR